MKMIEVRKKERIVRAQNPFDDGAKERLRRMGLLNADDEIERENLVPLSGVYAGILFDDLCDHYQDYDCVQENLRQLYSAAENAEGRQKFLLLCLQYDALSQSLPNPIWWISGNPALAGAFADSYIRHLKQLSETEEVS